MNGSQYIYGLQDKFEVTINTGNTTSVQNPQHSENPISDTQSYILSENFVKKKKFGVNGSQNIYGLQDKYEVTINTGNTTSVNTQYSENQISDRQSYFLTIVVKKSINN